MPSRWPDSRSPEAMGWRKWYKTYRWQQRRAGQLRDEPLCANCLRYGRMTVATVADHVVKHNGDAELFWHGKLQSLCDADPWRCHSSAKQSEERIGFVKGSDIDGRPTDAAHPWNR